jgi:Predicted transcriptional regulator
MAFNPIHVIFGLKLRQARLSRGLSVTELAERSGLSPSYITEIEKGRKYPKAERIMDLAQALGYDYDELVSLRLDPPLSFLETPLLSQLLKNFPLELFGVDPGAFIDVVTRSPAEISALIKALQGIARAYAIRDEHFYLAALRSYQELNRNYFPELEEAARRYAREQGWDDGALPRDEATLADVLRRRFGYDIDVIPVETHPRLASYRMILVPGGRSGRSGGDGGRARPRLLLNPALMPSQRKFLLAREIGYNVLGLEERALTNSPDGVESFAQVLNDFKASYFGGALLMPEARVVADLRELFGMNRWCPQRLLQMLDDYEVTPETLLYRFSELVPRWFDLKVHFLRFNEVNGEYRLYKHLNMNELSLPTGFDLPEHYCRRWLTVRLLREFAEKQKGGLTDRPWPGIQRSRFLESNKQFLCMGFARRENLPPYLNTSVILGIRMDDELDRIVKFASDPAIPEGVLNETCERCPLSDEECGERAAPPSRWLQEQAVQQRRRELEALLQGEPAARAAAP